MDKSTIHRPWLVSAVVACVVCVTALVASRASMQSSTGHEVLTDLAWMAAIVAAVCLVRGGFDAGVHHTAKQRVRSR